MKKESDGTKRGPQNAEHHDLDNLIEDVGHENVQKFRRLHEQIENLQEQLTQERDARREDWFFGILIAIILFNIMFFSVMPSALGPLALLILQIIVLSLIAKRLGVEQIVLVLRSVLDRLSGSLTNND